MKQRNKVISETETQFKQNYFNSDNNDNNNNNNIYFFQTKSISGSNYDKSYSAKNIEAIVATE